MVILRTILAQVAALLLCACTSLEGTTADEETWTSEMKQAGATVASATARGAGAVGDSLGTAYKGVTTGFEDPARSAYGPYPKDYVRTIRKHMLRFEDVPETAGFRFGKPERSYLNKGLFRGGEIEWQGWIVDVAIETTTAFGQPHTDEYVVRMNDGDVVEVLEAEYAGALRRVSKDPPTSPAAPAR
jgi:hypothetical protein